MTSPLAAHVDAAAEAVRAANHATFRAALDGPEAHAVVGSLAELVHRLPQLLDYLTRSMRRADPAEHYDDRGQDPAHALAVAHGALTDARGVLGELAGYVDQARNHLGHVGRRTTED